MKQIHLLWLGALMSLLCLAACDPPEAFPVYLKINQPTVSLDPSGNFRSDAGIRDVWVEHNGQTVGVYRAPRVIPLLPDAENRMVFFGGIFETGLSSVRSRYPFWQAEFLTLNDLTGLDTVEIDLNFFYQADSLLAFPLVEDFEGASLLFENEASGSNATSLFTTSSEKFRGNGAGKVSFGNGQNDFEIISSDFLVLPQTGANDIYVEVTYKNNVAFTAGLFYFSPSIGFGDIPAGLFFQSEDSWKTVYLHFNDQVRGAPRDARFKLYFRANSGDESGEILLDDIRVVHFR